ncbi:MAG: hypothetical protein AAFV96_04665, partial [Pseudomonadota bacterium]
MARGLARADLAVLVGAPAARAACLGQWPALEALNAEGRLMEARLRPLETGLPPDAREGHNRRALERQAGLQRPKPRFHQPAFRVQRFESRPLPEA